MLQNIIKNEEVRTMAKNLGQIFVLSLILEAFVMVMTVNPVDLNLIKILFTDLRLVLMNLFPLFFSMIIVYFLSNSIGTGFLVTGGVFYLLTFINKLKMLYRDSPLYIIDLGLGPEAGTMMKSYPIVMDRISAVILICVALVTLCCYVFLRGRRNNVKVRLIGGLISALLFVTMVFTFYVNNVDLYIASWHPEFGNEFKDSNEYMSRGFVYSFGRSLTDVLDSSPEGYDERRAEEILSGYKSLPMEEDKKVNFICIMLEAYNDFSRFPEIEFNVSPYANFHKLQEDSYSGKLYTNVFAGNTINTERAFLAGFGGGDIKRTSMSHVWYLRSQGYYTEAMHPGYGWFYDRKNISEYLGFESFKCQENEYESLDESEFTEEKYQGLLSDADFFRQIIKGYEDCLNRGQKYFNFSVTYQNHGPYSEEKITDTEYIVKKKNYPENLYNMINNYLHGIKRTDDAIQNIREYIDSSEEPAVLVLFGDHNPFLGSENSGYEMLGIDIDTETSAGAENYYCTPYVFYANTAAKKVLDKDFKGTGTTVSSFLLMNELFEYMGLEGSYYLSYLSDFKDDFDVVNLDYAGKANKLKPRTRYKNNTAISERQWVEYYIKSKGKALIR